MYTSFVRFCDRSQQRVQVVAVIAERYLDRLGAQLARVDRIARERRPPAHDLIALVQHGLRDPVDETVGSRTDRDLLEANAMAFGEGSAEAVRASVRITIQLAGATLQGFERLRERAERPFVGGELHDSVEAELALNLFDRLARLDTG